MKDKSPSDMFRDLPAIGTWLAAESAQPLIAQFGRSVVRDAMRAELGLVREARTRGEPSSVPTTATVKERLVRAQAETLVPVINAAGILVHTNLGRAPLADEALDAMASVAGACTLELDPESGTRGDRSAHALAALRALTGAEDGVVVNNGAAALLLVTAALAAGRDVVVSRGELVEIGGGFRVPDLVTSAGARLLEVGTTNRTHRSDYEASVAPQTGIVLKVHRSNFALVGFTCEVSLVDLAALAAPCGVPLVYDAGSGWLVGEGPGGERTVSASIQDGADLVLFSGDKLLGGPQAGIIVGRRDLVERLRRHPLYRALRLDKLRLAALGATLALWQRAPERLPIVRMLRTSAGELEARGRALVTSVTSVRPHAGSSLSVVPTSSRVGGGASPEHEVPSIAVRVLVADASALARALRLGTPSVVGRIEAGAVLLDLRSVAPGEDAALSNALVAVFSLDD